jgi:nickel-type superoxide dismutase maturation protease
MRTPLPYRGTLAAGLLVASTVALLWAPARAAGVLVRRSWASRVAIAGRSMEPALEDGDWVLVDPDAYRTRGPGAGELVLAPDPREPERLLIKRVGGVERDGRLTILGDAPDASTDSREFGTIAAAEVRGRPWFRYWPLERLGPLR